MTIKPFTAYNQGNIPECLRMLATQIEHGEIESERVLVILEQAQGSPDFRAFGTGNFSYAHAAGICLATANKLVEA